MWSCLNDMAVSTVMRSYLQWRTKKIWGHQWHSMTVQDSCCSISHQPKHLGFLPQNARKKSSIWGHNFEVYPSEMFGGFEVEHFRLWTKNTRCQKDLSTALRCGGSPVMWGVWGRVVKGIAWYKSYILRSGHVDMEEDRICSIKGSQLRDCAKPHTWCNCLHF